MDSLLAAIRTTLNKHIDPVYKAGSLRFSKEEINPLGVRTGTVRKIGKQFYAEVAHLSKKDLFDLCEQLLARGTCEEHTIAFQWAYARGQEYVPRDFARFERWLKRYVSNWGDCDDFCTHAFGHLLWRYPALVCKTTSWTKSNNRWLRRASAVVHVYPMWGKNRDVKKDLFLSRVFATADALLMDDDDLVQKGYGWMLKAASYKFPAEVFAYVMKHKNAMPRTALRYAIEKFPKDMKREAMKKN